MTVLSEPYRGRMLAWIEALESDRYEQGQSYLEFTEPDGTVRHCCLGVLTRVAMADGVEMETCQFKGMGHRYEPVGLITGFTLNKTSGLTPAPVQDWMGEWTLLTNVPDERFPPTKQGRLIRMNDDGEDFHVIAAKLREWFELPKEPADG